MKSSKFLMAWELGDNLGHVATLKGVARNLVKKGHKVVFASPNPAAVGQFFDENVRIVQAPRPKLITAPKGRQLSYCHVVRPYGFNSVAALKELIVEWRALYETEAPDCVVLNAPAVSLLAARKRAFKLAVVGTGYHLPPPTLPLPPFLEEDVKAPYLADELMLEEVMNEALIALDLPPVSPLYEMFDMDAQFLTTFKELDHYPSRQGQDIHYYGSQFVTDEGEEVQWPDAATATEAHRLFVYVRPDSQHFRPLLRALRALPVRAIVSAPGITNDDLLDLTAPNLAIHPGVVKLSTLRSECDLAINAGGHGTTTAFMLAGVPLLLLPNHVEQLMVARAAVKTGAALVPSFDKQIDLNDLIMTGLTQESYRQAAGEFAERYKDFDPDEQAASIVDELTALLTRELN